VDEQKKELRDYKKKTKAQTPLPQVEPVPLTIEEDLHKARAMGRRLLTLKGDLPPL
jgi:hypothetical protein